MKIADILEAKGRVVHSVRPSSTVAQVVDRLGAVGVGALLVGDEQVAIRGIVSERDVVRGLREHGAALLEMPVTAVLTSQVRTCTPQESIALVMARMTTGRFRHLPVVDGRALVGMVSIGDLVKHRVREMEMETGVLRDVVIARH
ncbi:CBS domain-containing protein [Pseudonocardia humida]|uniref:CBS domain-containing protein n=1 Tax=Pseudonocardia humida TaxID=2800819 RepID=A0ABT0ZSW1_9PSEU|nr:CBS domain-containing protein [Pseudonocardia humida]MCO1653813.1 CBS domain-containing protein [Pseudonocardia humida]